MTDIYLDENLSEHVAGALNLLNKGDFEDFKVVSTKTKFGKGATDEDIIPKIGNENGILITKDIKIQKTSLQYDLCKRHGLRMFFLKLPKEQNKHWEIVKLLINHWEEIIEHIKKEKPPFAYRVRVKGKMEKL